MAEKLRNWCWKKRLQRITGKHTMARKPVGLSGALSVGIYYAYEDRAEYEALLAFARSLAGRSKKVALLVFSDEKDTVSFEEDGLSLCVITKKGMGFDKFPRRRFVRQFESFFHTEYDLLIDFSREFHYGDVSVMALCTARMKVGKYGEWNVKVNDLSLGADLRNGYVRSFIRTAEAYLPLFDASGSGKKI